MKRKVDFERRDRAKPREVEFEKLAEAWRIRGGAGSGFDGLTPKGIALVEAMLKDTDLFRALNDMAYNLLRLHTLTGSASFLTAFGEMAEADLHTGDLDAKLNDLMGPRWGYREACIISLMKQWSHIKSPTRRAEYVAATLGLRSNQLESARRKVIRTWNDWKDRLDEPKVRAALERWETAVAEWAASYDISDSDLLRRPCQNTRRRARHESAVHAVRGSKPGRRPTS